MFLTGRFASFCYNLRMLYILIVPILLVLWVAASYNRLIVLRNRSKEASADIDVQLKRRYDLIPNLVEAVKGYMGHEQKVLEGVTEARTRAMGAHSGKEKEQAENALSGTLKTLFAVAENYPQLKANENFLQLQNELTDTENKIQASRRFYNTNVMEFNTKIEVFPSNIVAKMFNFAQMDLFAVSNDAEREPVKVKF